jgi:molybdopterin-guanine dinucleotide biosynthesis protein A
MLSAAILAGGQATRFGGLDKGALRVEGRSIRERQLAELAMLSGDALDVMIVGGPPAPLVPSGAFRWVADREPGLGPLGGVHTALLEAAGDPVIVLACDMPYVSAPLLGHLRALARGFDAVVPRTEGGYHPLCAVYARTCVEPIARRLAAGQLKMASLFDDVRVREVGVEELRTFGDVDRLLANVNSPADHEDLVAHERPQSRRGHQR